MLSIVIPSYNQHEMTQDCLSAIRANTRDYELILVDNGSTPPYSVESVHKRGSLIRNENNTGFPFAINQGIRQSRGDVILLLNNDCIVSAGWAFWLMHHLETYSIVSPVTNYCAGIQRVTAPVYHNEGELAQVAEKWAKDHAGESQEVNWVIGFCMAFKKSLWEEIGPFDESLWPCSGEELAFCLRARHTGHRIGIASAVYVHHHGSQTFKDLEQSGQVKYNEICARNEKHVMEKWGEFWTKQLIEEAA
jgi:GT2 family glycosyltransferase